MFIPDLITRETLIEMDRNEGMTGIRQLASARPQVVAYGCTASSIVQGVVGPEALAPIVNRWSGVSSRKLPTSREGAPAVGRARSRNRENIVSKAGRKARKTAVTKVTAAIMSEAATLAGLTPAQTKAIKKLSAKLGRSPADVMDEAVNDVLAKYGRR